MTDEIEHSELIPPEENRTDRAVARAVQELLRFGFLQQATKAEVYLTARTYEAQIQQILEPLDLSLKIDESRGLMVVQVYMEEAGEESKEELVEASWTHPLVRRQRLTLEQSLLIALLRRHFLLYEEHKGIGTGEVVIVLEEVVSEMTVFFGDSGSDQNNTRRVSHLLSQLKDHGIVSAIDEHGEFTIRPVIVYFANPENLKVLLEQFKEESKS